MSASASEESVTVSSECDISDIAVPIDTTVTEVAIGGKVDIKAKSAILMEPYTGEILYEQNCDEKLPPASITKIMSLLLVMEATDGGILSLEDIVTASEHATITLPASFEGKIYLPYSDSQTKDGVLTMKLNAFILTAYLTEDLPMVTLDLDSFRNYNFEELGNLTTTTFDKLTSLDSLMWNYSGYSELSSEDTDGGIGQSVKATVSSSASVGQRFKNLAPSTNISTYAGEQGFRFWISNPNDFQVSAMARFYQYQRALVGKKYYHVNENGTVTGHCFKALHPEADPAHFIS